MGARRGRDMTVEEFNDWAAAREGFAAVREAGGEEGGPHLSLVPLPGGLAYAQPTEIVGSGAPAEAMPNAVPFDPEPSRNRCAGWSAMRQRIFIEALAETGSVHQAAKGAGLSARSAYALRIRSAAFACAWDAAQQLAVGRLSSLAFDRAINGRVEQVFHDSNLVHERRVPSDKLLMWLLTRLDPARFALPWERSAATDPQAAAALAFPAQLAALEDTPQFAARSQALLDAPDDEPVTANIAKIEPSAQARRRRREASETKGSHGVSP